MADDTTVNTEKTGGTRYSQGKQGGWWFIPLRGLNEVAKVSVAGALKYAPLDWAEGQSFSTLLDCMFRHVLKVMEGGPKVIDEDTGAYHLACAAWNILCLLTFINQGRTDLDDVTPWYGVSASDAKVEGWSYLNCTPPYWARIPDEPSNARTG
ncbi:MAG: hypothetical protein AMS18_00460 [Gemmatimonas sp. SG8_17]|nr:MAG: hypothetical protein AMS18_00460 [Gemmatimonas sp. SG8_17]